MSCFLYTKKQFPVLLVLLFFAGSVLASPSISLEEVLDVSGQITNPQNHSGKVDFSGFYPVIDDCRGLVFLPAPGWNAMGSGANGTVHSIVISGNDVYIGGIFGNAGGVSGTNFIARWDGSSWNALGSGVNSFVFDIDISGTDLYVGGYFTSAGGVTGTNRIARWDLNGMTWHALNSGVNDIVVTVAVSGTDLYVGGLFTDAGGIAAADYIVRWDGSSWNALGSGLNSTVDNVAFIGSDVYVGGNFTDAGGIAAADRIARWDGSSWNALGSGLNNQVKIMTASGSNLYVGGYFTDAGGVAAADRIARWNGSSWNALGSGITGAYVHTIAVSGSSVYVGGSFSSAGGVSSTSNIARWDGTSWNAVGSGLNDGVHSLVLSDGNLFASGYFTDAGGNTDADRIARWEDAALPIELLSFYARPLEKHIALEWQTATEYNNQGWEIEHSTDSEKWEVLSFEVGNGNSTQQTSYTFLHQNPALGMNYYRLHQLDYDGSSSYSQVATAVISGDSEIRIFPSVTAGPVYISEMATEVSVYDTYGNLLLKLENASELDLNGKPAGVYFVQAVVEGKMVAKKVVLR